jgi:hypothetical protein
MASTTRRKECADQGLLKDANWNECRQRRISAKRSHMLGQVASIALARLFEWKTKSDEMIREAV